MNVSLPSTLPERTPRVGELVHVRSRQWLVEEVVDPPAPGESARVRLFIADDTGLGKTIEAGLIARELLLRRKAKVIVAAVPPSVLEQWKSELEDRFGLVFVILDRSYVSRMRRERGFGVNPWRTHSRFLVSHNLLIDPAYADPMIAQGDTRSTGLRWICTHGGDIYRARRRVRWPGLAAVVVSVLHVHKGPFTGVRRLDDAVTDRITAFLFHRGGHDDPAQLGENARKKLPGQHRPRHGLHVRRHGYERGRATAGRDATADDRESAE